MRDKENLHRVIKNGIAAKIRRKGGYESLSTVSSSLWNIGRTAIADVERKLRRVKNRCERRLTKRTKNTEHQKTRKLFSITATTGIVTSFSSTGTSTATAAIVRVSFTILPHRHRCFFSFVSLQNLSVASISLRVRCADSNV